MTFYDVFSPDNNHRLVIRNIKFEMFQKVTSGGPLMASTTILFFV